MHMNASMGDLEVKGKRGAGHNMNLSEDLFGESVGRELRSRGGG